VVEPTALRFLDKRMAELTHQYESRTRQEIGDELSELAVIRDQLKTILEMSLGSRELQFSKDFPTLGTFVQRITTLAHQIARTSKGDPQRHELLNEMTWLCLMADSHCKREL
jgi:hypothetical protein